MHDTAEVQGFLFLEWSTSQIMPNTDDVECANGVQELSIHGWPKIFSTSSRSRKIFWAILCLLSLGLFVNFAKDIFDAYGKRETYVTTTMMPVTSLALPAMTFCNTNLFFIPTNSSDNSGIPVGQDFQTTCSNYNANVFENAVNKQFFENACKTFMALSRLPTIKYDSLKFDLRFPSNFTFVPHYWPCFKLNKDGRIIQREGSEANGLKMMLFFNESEKSDVNLSMPNPHINNWHLGIYVDIHDQSEYIGKLEGISLAPGVHTLIKLKKVTFKRKKYPFASNCYDDDDNMYVKAIPGKHTIPSCFLACRLDFLYRRCGDSTEIGGPFVNRTLYSKKTNKSIEEIRACLINNSNEFNPLKCDCRLPCLQTVYETQVTYRSWPQSSQLKQLLSIFHEVTGLSERDMDIELIKKHFVQVTIYYPDLVETEIIEKEAYGIEKVISDFGGQMGMFLGASFLSLIEIIVLIYEYVKRSLNKQKTAVNNATGSIEDNDIPNR